MIIASILLKISDFKLFNENYNFIIINLIALLGINIIANSFFVSLLVIKEKDFVQTVITKN